MWIMWISRCISRFFTIFSFFSCGQLFPSYMGFCWLFYSTPAYLCTLYNPFFVNKILSFFSKYFSAFSIYLSCNSLSEVLFCQQILPALILESEDILQCREPIDWGQSSSTSPNAHPPPITTSSSKRTCAGKSKDFRLRNSLADAQPLPRHILLARYAPPRRSFLIYRKFGEFPIWTSVSKALL